MLRYLLVFLLGLHFVLTFPQTARKIDYCVFYIARKTIDAVHVIFTRVSNNDLQKLITLNKCEN